jgi:phage portal protein BeeE
MSRLSKRQLLEMYGDPRVRAVVGKIGDSVADALNFRAFRRVGVDLVEVPDHPLHALLEDPNGQMTGRALIRLSQIYLEMVGSAFVALQRVGPSTVGLWPIPPSWVVSLPDGTLPAEQQVYTIAVSGRRIREFPAADILHFKTVDPEDTAGFGLGAAEGLEQDLDTAAYASTFLKNFVFNDALPAAIIAIDGLPSGDQPEAKRFKESLAREYEGPGKAGRVMLTGGKARVARLDSKFDGETHVALQDFFLKSVRQTFGVPPEILGDTDEATRGGIRAARVIFDEQVVAPRVAFWVAEFQQKLAPLVGGDVVLTFDPPGAFNRKKRLAAMRVAPEAYTVNEARALSGHAPIAGERGERRFGEPYPAKGGE